MEYFGAVRYNDLMRRISTALTFVNKRVFPGVWFAVVLIVACMAVPAVILRGEPVFILLVPLAMAAIGYLVMKAFIFDLMDQVYLDGDELVVQNGGEEARIPLAHVINVNVSILTNPERITLMLSEPSTFGDEITFSPLHRWFPFARHPLAKELIGLAHDARRRRDGGET